MSLDLKIGRVKILGAERLKAPCGDEANRRDLEGVRVCGDM